MLILNANITAINAVQTAPSTDAPSAGTTTSTMLSQSNAMAIDSLANSMAPQASTTAMTSDAATVDVGNINNTVPSTMSVTAAHIKTTIKKLCKPSAITTMATVIIKNLQDALQEYLERGWMAGYGKGRDEGWAEAVQESEQATVAWKK